MRVLIVIALMVAGSGLWAESLPEWLIPLREAVFEQELNENGIKPLYEAAKAASAQRCAGAALDLALSRCEYYMGLFYRDEERKEEASGHFGEGMRLAEKSLKTAPSAEAWQVLAENQSLACQVRSVGYTMANGLNVEKYAKSALALNSRNAAAQYLIAARWVYAPAPFHNHKKGTQMMEAILTEGDMDKDDLFRVYSGIGYGYMQQKKHAEARLWLAKSLEVYPTNKYAAELLAAAK